ncbi:MAG: LemA family protein [Patescibacteria group bacterium]
MIILMQLLNQPLWLWIVTLVLFILLLWLWAMYNAFIAKRNQVKTDFADIDVQIKRRASLIENLAAAIKQYATHERKTFENVTQARSAVQDAKSPKEAAQAENFLTQTLRSLFAVSEAYPKLQASQNYKSLTDQLEKTENLIAQYRETYNQTVLDFNTMLQTFPNLLVARLFGFKEEELFVTTPADNQEVKLSSE